MNFDTIPTLDLNDYLHGDVNQKKVFAQKLGDIFSGIGFAIVANHGIAQDLINNSYKAFQDFYALEDSVKKSYEIDGLGGQRGYTGKGKEHAKGSSTGDLKEFFHIGQTPKNPALIEEYPANIFVKEVPGIENYAVDLYSALEFAGINLLRAIADYLELPNDYFDEKVKDGNSILRPIHYFAIPDPDSLPADAVRAAEHEDINLITLLIGASADGLEVKNSEGAWIAAKPQPEQIVVNVGDMLQRLTNNRLKSTTHRVVNPARELMHLPRYSMPFFCHPQGSMDLSCLESCISETQPKLHEDITAGDYLNQRLREIGLLK